MNQDIDVQIGKRLYQRRRLLGLTQAELGAAVGASHQSIQKYECGANKISAPLLWTFARTLEVSIDYFYAGLSQGAKTDAVDLMEQPETLDLVRCYYAMGRERRRRLLGFAQAFEIGRAA